MSLQGIKRRMAKVEQNVGPKKDDDLISLEELCRAVWRQDKIEPGNGQYRSLISQFEREEMWPQGSGPTDAAPGV